MKKQLRHICVAIATGLASVTLLGGCSLDVAYENQFSDPDAISSLTTARELLAGAYNDLPNPEFDLTLLTDDLAPTFWANSNPSMLNQYNWQPQSLIDLSAQLWPQYYNVISTVNALLERLPAVKTKDDIEAKVLGGLKAEALTLKAYCYLQLLRLYGPDEAKGHEEDPGIILKDEVRMQTLPRSSVRGCVAEIRRLLTEASAAERVETADHWLLRDASLALLAELELYAGNYADAASIAGELVNRRGLASLAPAEYSRLWGGDSCAERIFTYRSANSTSSHYLSIVYDSSGGDYFTLSPQLAASFAGDDCRREWTVFMFASPSLGELTCLGKYNALRKRQLEISVINKLRLSGVCLLRAEACFLAGLEGDARSAIEDYLTARGLDASCASVGGDALMRLILDEKRKEFAGEGERYFDLKRYGGSYLSGWTVSQAAARRIRPDDYRWLMPLPKDEYLYNENASQNPGWPERNN